MGRGRGRGWRDASARRTEADYRRTDRGGQREDRVVTHQSSRSSPPSTRHETAAASAGGQEPRPGPSRGSPPLTKASGKKARLDSPKGRSSEASEVTIIQTVAKKKKENKKKLVTRSPLVVTEDMLPTRHWYLRDGKLLYKPHQETMFQCSSTLKEEKTWLRTISFPLKPVSFVDKLLRPSRLPVPQGKDNILKELAKDPGMMLKPRPKYEDCHTGSCSCVRLGQKDVHHRTSVLHDICLRDGSMTEEDLAVESRFKNFVENPTHYYYWSEVQRTICWLFRSHLETMVPGPRSSTAPSSPTARTSWPPSSTWTCTARRTPGALPTSTCLLPQIGIQPLTHASPNQRWAVNYGDTPTCCMELSPFPGQTTATTPWRKISFICSWLLTPTPSSFLSFRGIHSKPS